MSRQRSGRAAKPAAKAAKPGKSAKPVKAARGATAARARGVYVQSPKSDVYVTLLGVALGAMALACLLLFLVFSRYEMKQSPTAWIHAPSATAGADLPTFMA